MFGKVMFFSIFYCLCYVKDIYTEILEDQVAEERYPGLNEEEDIILDEIREDHWRDVDEESDDNKDINALSWDVYIKEK